MQMLRPDEAGKAAGKVSKCTVDKELDTETKSDAESSRHKTNSHLKSLAYD